MMEGLNLKVSLQVIDIPQKLDAPHRLRVQQNKDLLLNEACTDLNSYRSYLSSILINLYKSKLETAIVPTLQMFIKRDNIPLNQTVKQIGQEISLVKKDG